VEGDTTVVPLELAAQDSFFVVFREAAKQPTAVVPKHAVKTVAEITTPWEVAFQAGRGAPAGATFATLQGFEQNADAGIRYFSGMANYRTTFVAPKGVKRGATLWLDLGRVGDVAEVLVNGKVVGTAWKAPYRLEIGGALQRGTNQLEVRVANLWVNRLIGDALPGATKVAAAIAPTYLPTAPLRPSGLMGPVRLLEVR
jgi:hypothetical protein